jgi:hypothetical protein
MISVWRYIVLSGDGHYILNIIYMKVIVSRDVRPFTIPD